MAGSLQKRLVGASKRRCASDDTYEDIRGMNSVVREQDASYLDSTSPNTGYLYAPDHGPDSVSAYITCNTPHSVHRLLERRFPPRPPQPARPM